MSTTSSISTPGAATVSDSQSSAASRSASSTTSSSNNNNRNNRFNNNGNSRGQNGGGGKKVSFKGDCKELQGVLGMNYEVIDGKKSFDEFQELLIAYVTREWDHGCDLSHLILDTGDPLLELVQSEKPSAPTNVDFKNNAIRIDYEKRYGMYLTRESKLKDNMKSLFHLILGQCSPALKSSIKGFDEFTKKSAEQDSQWLLKHIVLAMNGVSSSGNKYLILIQALRGMLNIVQYKHETVDDFQQRLTDAINAVKLAGGSNIFKLTELAGKTRSSVPSDDELAAAEDKFLAILFISRTDMTRYRSMFNKLKDDSHLGHDNFPTTWRAAYHAINNHSTDRGNGNRTNSSHHNGNFQHDRTRFTEVQFSQTRAIPGTDGRLHRDILCYKCQKKGHYASQCPSPPSDDDNATTISGISNFQVSTCLNQSLHPIINDQWILLDTGSTSSTIKNQSFLKDVRTCSPGEELHLISNGGTTVFKQHGTLSFLPLDVFFNPHSLANILSFKEVADIPGVRITIDTSSSRAIHVRLPNNNGTLVFNECNDGLYYLDMGDNHSNLSVNAYSPPRFSFLSTVSSNKAFFTQQQIEGADTSRLLQQYIGWPSTSDFKHFVSSNFLKNCPSTVEDINRSLAIYGELQPILKGKMTHGPASYTPVERVQLPAPILQHHKSVKLSMDIFFVNKLPFLHTKSRNINFLSVQALSTRNLSEIVPGLVKVKNKYEQRGFEIVSWEGDNEFNRDSIRDALAPATTEICGADEHVGLIERSIRTVKERCRCYCQSLPFKYYPRTMTRELIATVIYWLNSFPVKNGVSRTLSPGAIVDGRGPPNIGGNWISFGSYALVYSSTTNNMKSRATPAIALRPSNGKGGHYFMSVWSGKRIHGYRWKELPIDDDVISRVETIAIEEGRPKLKDEELLFEWGPGNEVGDEIEDEGNDDIDEMSILEENEQLDEQDEDIDLSYEDESADSHDTESSNESEYDPMSDDEDLSYDDSDEETNSQSIEDTTHVEEEMNDEDERNETVDEDTRDGPTRPDTQYNKNRPVREGAGAGIDILEMEFDGKRYKNRKVRARQAKQFMMKRLRIIKERSAIMDSKRLLNKAINVIFNQMSAKKGIEMFGERAVAAIFKEFKQLNEGPMQGKPVIGEICPESLSIEQKRQALGAVNLIKEKRNGDIKGRTCANGSRQRKYLKEDESVASPTISTEALVMNLVVAASEGRDVAVFDVPGAYLHAPVPADKQILMRIDGDFTDIMCKVNPEFKKHVRTVKGKKVLYVKVLRAIYGCIESALLWYNLFATTLESMGFKINPYDRCVANKDINGKQCTISWYVDDNVVTHEDPEVVTSVVNSIKEHFGELKVSRGKEHDFLGMKIIINDDKTVSLDMKDQVSEALEMFGETFSGTVSTPATKLLHYIKDSKRLSQSMSDKFHSVVAKLLFISKRGRPDIETTVSYLCTRVSSSTEDDYEKLRRLMHFIWQTKEDVRKVGGDMSMLHLNTWVDASYAVHADMRSQTGGCMSVGTGVLHARSSKQKLNSKSSTEAEIVGLSEYLPFNIWMCNYMKAQGYELKSNRIMQDNQSAIRMEKNGRNSCTGNSRHIDIRYFFVKDRVDKKECTIHYCPTTNMLADFFTKPLQGALFKALRNIIMGYENTAQLLSAAGITLEERVGNQSSNNCDTGLTPVNENSTKAKRVSYADIVKIRPLNGGNETIEKMKAGNSEKQKRLTVLMRSERSH